MANPNQKRAFNRTPHSHARCQQSRLNKLESLLVEPPVITKGFSEIELVNTSTMEFLRIIKKSTPTWIRTHRDNVSVHTSRLKSTPTLSRTEKDNVSSVHTSRPVARPESSSATDCQGTQQVKPLSSRTVRFQVRSTTPAKPAAVMPESQSLETQSQPVSFRNVEENRLQEEPHQTTILQGSQRQRMEGDSSDKEVRATRLLQIKLGITPEGMV